MQKDPRIIDEVYQFLFKILIPAFIAVSIKVAIQIKNEGVNYTRIIISFIAGIGCAYFSFPLIETYTSKEYLSIMIGIVAISGEKITEWFVYKFKVDVFLGALADFLLDKIRSKK